MPSPELDLIVAPPTTFRVSLEPAYNALNSMFLLTKVDLLSGLDDWVVRTSSTLSKEQARRNRLVSLGLYYALIPQRSFSSFPAYIDHLSSTDPTVLRDRILEAYFSMPSKDPGARTFSERTDILEDFDTFLRFLLDRFPVEHIDVEIETEAFSYLNNLPAMRQLIVNHLREMWQTVLAPEWQRVTPMLEESVAAFQHLDLNGLTNLEAIEKVTGQPMEDCGNITLEQAERIIFVPSAHLGPYLGPFKANGTLVLLFGARLPEGTAIVSPDLSRAEILVRLGALADDTRLRILKLIAESGELNSKDIMSVLSLSQSATSRHLTQLTATGYLEERRCEGAKCYTLNPERVESTLQAVAAYLEISNPTLP